MTRPGSNLWIPSTHPTEEVTGKLRYRNERRQCSLLVCWFQQHASVSQGRICSDKCTCCHTEIEVAGQTYYLIQSQYTDTGPTSPSADAMTPGAWRGQQCRQRQQRLHVCVSTQSTFEFQNGHDFVCTLNQLTYKYQSVLSIFLSLPFFSVLFFISFVPYVCLSFCYFLASLYTCSLIYLYVFTCFVFFLFFSSFIYLFKTVKLVAGL